MLWVLLASALVTDPPPPLTPNSIATLDAACRQTDARVALKLDPLGEEETGPLLETNEATVRRPYRALDDRVLVHVVGVDGWRWEGSGTADEALEKWRRNKATARAVGGWAELEDLPVCFGHAQIDARSVALEVTSLDLYVKGEPLGQFMPRRDSDPLTGLAGGPVELQIACGAPCAHAPHALTQALDGVRSALRQCFEKAPAGRLAFELRSPSGSEKVNIQGEVSTFSEPHRACAREALGRFELPRRAAPTAVVLSIETPPLTAD